MRPKRKGLKVEKITEESDEEGRARIIKLKYENALNMHVIVRAV